MNTDVLELSTSGPELSVVGEGQGTVEVKCSQKQTGADAVDLESYRAPSLREGPVAVAAARSKKRGRAEVGSG